MQNYSITQTGMKLQESINIYFASVKDQMNARSVVWLKVQTKAEEKELLKSRKAAHHQLHFLARAWVQNVSPI